MTEEQQQQQFESSNTCWICETLTDDDSEKVRDHCHITEKFRGPGFKTKRCLSL